MLSDHLVTKPFQSEVLEYEDVIPNSLEFSPSLLDENVNWISVQKFFTKEAWVLLREQYDLANCVMDGTQDGVQWKEIADSKVSYRLPT